MKQILIATIIGLAGCATTYAQQSASPLHLNTGALANIKNACHEHSAVQWHIVNNNIVREYEDDEYVLIDTAGLYVYTLTRYVTVSSMGDVFPHKTTEAYYSVGPNGDMYRLRKLVLRKNYKDFRDFVYNIQREDELYYHYPSPTQPNMTRINVLYNKYVKPIKQKCVID